MKRRKLLSKREQITGLFLYCKKCKKRYKDDTEVTCKCDCDLKFQARIHIPGTKNNVRSKTFDGESLSEVIPLFFKFKEELEETSFQRSQVKDEIVVPFSLLDCISAFIDRKNNVNVDYHERREQSEDYIRALDRTLSYFLYALKDADINPNVLPFETLHRNKKLTGLFVQYLEETVKCADRTYNNHIDNMKHFLRVIKREYYPNVDSPMMNLKKKELYFEPQAISIRNFNRMIALVTPENGMRKEKVNTKNGKKTRYKRRNMYRSWMVNAFYLALYTGGRTEEIGRLKWNHIVHNEDGEMSSIRIVDLKINRMMNKDVDDESKIKNLKARHILMTPPLEELLLEMGYEQYKDSNEYILAPEENLTRKGLMVVVSQSFVFFYDQLGLEDGLKFKHLRKTFVTEKYIMNPDEYRKQTGHGGDEVVQKHYLDKTTEMEERRKKIYDAAREAAEKKKEDFSDDVNSTGPIKEFDDSQ